MRMDHEIFQAPFTVAPTLVERPNPGYRRANPDGSNVPSTLPMWRVQTIGDFGEGGRNQLFGMVSRGDGFEDSPDAEFISGGVNTKDYGGVALGRQANYFHWGFSSSPTYMTEEAKLVFINAVHYIAKFDGHPVLAHKRRGIVLRDRLALDTSALKARVAELRAVQEDGPIAVPEAHRGVSKYFPEDAWESLAADAEGVVRRLEQDGPYLYPSAEYELGVDRELQALELPNHAPDFIPRMMEYFGSADAGQAAMLAGIMARYTNEALSTPQEWVAWMKAHRERVFFSESAGYKWLVELPRPQRR